MNQSEQRAVELTQLAEQETRLRTVEAERDALLAQNLLLCGANENLVLATFAAQELRDEAKAANQRQNEFLAMLAHELRNPLAAWRVQCFQECRRRPRNWWACKK